MQQKSDEQLEAAFDKNSYTDSQLIELKIPINLPYQTTWEDYQRYDGEIEVQGTLYKYVKRKVANDTLFMMCVPNSKKMSFESAKDNYFTISNDLVQNNHAKKSGTSKGVSIKNQQYEYDQYSFTLSVFSTLAGNRQDWLPIQLQHALAVPHISPEQPPDVHLI